MPSRADLEVLVNAYIERALRSPEDLEQMIAALGGLEISRSPDDALYRTEIASAIAHKVLGGEWIWDLIKLVDERYQVIILGRR